MSSLAIGAPLTQATFADFVERLRHDCVGDGVRDHCTADAFFVVQHKVRVGGMDKEYSDKRFIHDGANLCEYETPLDYWNNCEQEERVELNLIAMEQGDCCFLELDEDDQWGVFEDGDVEDHSVIYYEEKWETINFHFTKAAAEAFIKRKGHDYGEMRVYVDAHTYGWEYNAIKQALLDGSLMFVGMPKVIETERCSPAQSRACLVAAKAFSDAGLSFVPVPVFGEDDARAFAELSVGRAEALAVVLEGDETNSQGGDA